MRRPCAGLLKGVSSSSAGARTLRSAAPIARRGLHIEAAPSTTSPTLNATNSYHVDSPDARFEVLGAPYSLLSVSLSASQNLYTRRGTLVGISGKAENARSRHAHVFMFTAVSTLSVLEPVRRAALGIPFLYQRVSLPAVPLLVIETKPAQISSTSPLTALISSKSTTTTFAIVHLNGTIDWMVAQRSALLAWTGHSLAPSPRVNRKLGLAHWGSTHLTGRGLVALTGSGQIYTLTLGPGEEYIAAPSNVVAYTLTSTPPKPHRLKSSTLSIPSLPSLLAPLSSIVPASLTSSRFAQFLTRLRATPTYRFLSNGLYALRTWARRAIWGDRLFLRFQGPATILIQSRASRLGKDVLSQGQVDEIADAPATAVEKAVGGVRVEGEKEKEKENKAGDATASSTSTPTTTTTGAMAAGAGAASPPTQAKPQTETPPTKVSHASVEKDGHVSIKADG
ncbi:MAG: hypothetical protein M1819_005764 [Sarea resinae]|nr:MAG: hypothetical protein M1819_005764 [Sarea resinae]